jgi:hypothetical protein
VREDIVKAGLGVEEVKRALEGVAAKGRSWSRGKNSGQTWRYGAKVSGGVMRSCWGGGSRRKMVNEIGKWGGREFGVASDVIGGNSVDAIGGVENISKVGGRKVIDIVKGEDWRRAGRGS